MRVACVVGYPRRIVGIVGIVGKRGIVSLETVVLPDPVLHDAITVDAGSTGYQRQHAKRDFCRKGFCAAWCRSRDAPPVFGKARFSGSPAGRGNRIAPRNRMFERVFPLFNLSRCNGNGIIHKFVRSACRGEEDTGPAPVFPCETALRRGRSVEKHPGAGRIALDREPSVARGRRRRYLGSKRSHRICGRSRDMAAHFLCNQRIDTVITFSMEP